MKKELRRKPHMAQPKHNARDAWWYENATSIDVLIQHENGGVAHCRIQKRHILQWLKRTES